MTRDLAISVAGAYGLRLFPIVGDSMEPTVKRGDFVLVKPVDRYDYDGCYVLGSPLGPALYRVDCIGPTCRVISDNKRYGTYEIAREALNQEILAKAVFKINVMDRLLVPPELRL